MSRGLGDVYKRQEPYLDAEDIIRGVWSTDKKGNIILEIDNGSRIVLNKKAVAE